MILADGPIITIGIEAAGVIATALGGGLVGAAKILVTYFRERDTARDELNEAQQKQHTEAITRELRDRAEMANQFTDRLRGMDDDRKNTMTALLDLSRETVAAITTLQNDVRNLQTSIAHIQANTNHPPLSGRMRRPPTADPPG